jgi:hypothetical protein
VIIVSGDGGLPVMDGADYSLRGLYPANLVERPVDSINE